MTNRTDASRVTTGIPNLDAILNGGLPKGSVTVVAGAPARAEVLTKALFLAGARSIGAEARRRSVAALWVGVDGSVSTSGPMDRYVVWRAA